VRIARVMRRHGIRARLPRRYRERVHQRDYPDREAARRDLFAYIEGYYNRRRSHSAIGYITPEQADRKSA
jgi:transposase InsO family protein